MTGRILLIDDEDVFREDIASLLRHEGYACDAAACGDEGLRYATAEAPDVILCDMVMPGIAGAELVRGLAAACPETPIVVITAHYALFQTANNTAVLTNIRQDQRGVISGMLSLSRNVGLIAGASVMGAIFAASSMRITFVVAAVLILGASSIAVRARACECA